MDVSVVSGTLGQVPNVTLAKVADALITCAEIETNPTVAINESTNQRHSHSAAVSINRQKLTGKDSRCMLGSLGLDDLS